MGGWKMIRPIIYTKEWSNDWSTTYLNRSSKSSWSAIYVEANQLLRQCLRSLWSVAYSTCLCSRKIRQYHIWEKVCQESKHSIYFRDSMRTLGEFSKLRFSHINSGLYSRFYGSVFSTHLFHYISSTKLGITHFCFRFDGPLSVFHMPKKHEEKRSYTGNASFVSRTLYQMQPWHWFARKLRLILRKKTISINFPIFFYIF